MRSTWRGLGGLLVLVALLVLWAQAPVHGQPRDEDDDDIYPPPHWATESTFALIAVPRANIRTAPSTVSGVVVSVVRLGERYPIADATEPEDIDDDGDEELWYLLDFGGSRGWIFGDLVLVANPQRIEQGPQTPSEAQQRHVEEQLRQAQQTFAVRANVNLRRGPGTSFGIVGRVPYSGRVDVLGRNFYGTWLYVNYNGQLGWVSAQFVAFPPGVTLDSIPVR